MARLFFVGFIKVSMMTTPFLTLILMLLALWGVGGKATYTDLNYTKQEMEAVVGKAKNYLVNGKKSNELCTTDLEIPKTGVEKEKNLATEKESMPIKIDWDHVV